MKHIILFFAIMLSAMTSYAAGTPTITTGDLSKIDFTTR